MMENNFIRKSAVVFSFIALVTYGVIFACADYFVEYDDDSSFTPEVYVDRSYAPLFFSPGEFFYRINFDDGNATRFNDAVVDDWSVYLNGKLPDKQIAFFLLSDSADAPIKQLYGDVQKKRKPSAPYQTINLSDVKIKSFVEFLYYAKIIEQSCTASSESWNYDESKPPVVNSQIVTQLEKMHQDASDVFLKNRYWFQTMKAHFYSANRSTVISFFEKTKATVPLNTLYYRGLGYVAGAHYSAKNFALSNYLFSIVFDKCEALRTVGVYNFHPQDQAAFNASLALAKTPEEKASLWALFGYYADEKNAIREIYKLNPASTHLDYLLTRLVNKEESMLSGIEFTSAEGYRQTVKGKINKETMALVNSIAKEGKTAKPYLWNLAAGYLTIFSGNYVDARQLIDKAEKQGPKTDLATQQIRLLRLINQLSSISKMDEKTQAMLLPELDWLYKMGEKGADEEFRFRRALRWSRQYISSLYHYQQNGVFGELFQHDKNYFMTASNAEAMKTFLQKNDKSPWEKLALSIYGYELQDIYEFQGVMSAYNGNLDASIAYMEQSASKKNTELLGNPFNGKIKDCHDCDHAAPQKVKYSRLSFLKKMKEMQTHVEKNEDVYNNSLLLANGFYNLTYYGNARIFYEGSIMEQGGTNYISKQYVPYLLNCALARKYYQSAFEAATNPEQKAKCLYMLAKCERNEHYTKNNCHTEGYYGSEDIDFLAWEGFKKLRSDYSTTRYYNDVINECGYFRTYVENAK